MQDILAPPLTHLDLPSPQGRDNNVTIDDLCSVMADVQRGPPLARYAAVAAMMSGYSPLDVSFSAEVIGLSATSWDSPAAMGGEY